MSKLKVNKLKVNKLKVNKLKVNELKIISDSKGYGRGHGSCVRRCNVICWWLHVAYVFPV